MNIKKYIISVFTIAISIYKLNAQLINIGVNHDICFYLEPKYIVSKNIKQITLSETSYVLRYNKKKDVKKMPYPKRDMIFYFNEWGYCDSINDDGFRYRKTCDYWDNYQCLIDSLICDTLYQSKLIFDKLHRLKQRIYDGRFQYGSHGKNVDTINFKYDGNSRLIEYESIHKKVGLEGEIISSDKNKIEISYSVSNYQIVLSDKYITFVEYKVGRLSKITTVYRKDLEVVNEVYVYERW